MTPLKPFKHQKKSLAHAKTTPIVFDMSDPGTGKTGVRIWAFAERRKKGGGCALVIAPRSLLFSTWVNDFKKFAPHLKVVVATAANRAKAFAEEADVYVTNTDAAVWLGRQNKKFFDKFDTLDIDESSAYKHHTSARSRAISKITKYFEYRCCMTGTPNSRSITDVWHQAYLLDGGERLGSSFYAFRNAVCEAKQVGRNENAIQWTDKEGAQEAVYNLLRDITIRHKFEECTDVPPNFQTTLEYELPPKQRKAYEAMKQDQLLMIRKKGGKDIDVITAANAAVVAGKLLQVASGAVYESETKYHVIDDSRYNMTIDLVEEREHSLVLFAWLHQMELLVAEAERRKIKYCVIRSTDNDTRRAAMVAQYQAGMFQVMFAHPKSAAHGYTLTRGDTTIWPSPIMDTELWMQGSKRQHRIGQTKKTHTMTILGKNTYDETAYDICQGKRTRMLTLLDLMGTT